VLRGFAVAVLVLVAGLAAFVQIQQHILRWRAERLLADIRQIQMGKSTWADAQRLMYKWGAWGKWEGPCTAEGCEYQIMLPDALQAVTTHFWERTPLAMREERHFYRQWELHLYSLLGGRITQIRAGVHLKNGIIWTKSYAVYTARSFYEYGVEEFLIGTADGETRFTHPAYQPGLKLHPEYSLKAAGPCDGCSDGSCTVCRMIGASFTPFAAPGIVSQLFDFNLRCITSRKQCDDPKEIMPSTWHLYRLDQEELAKQSGPPNARAWNKCDSPVEFSGRDYRFALLTEVVKIQTSPDSGFTRYVASLRGLRSLKNGAAFREGLLKDPFVGWSDTVLPGGVRMADLKPGSRIILMFEWPLGDPGLVSYGDPCSYIPDTDQNRAAIQRGIDRDKLADVP
jgi:hypothetical protein